MSCERSNVHVQRNVEKARLINRRTYLPRRNVVKTLRGDKRWEEKLLSTSVE